MTKHYKLEQTSPAWFEKRAGLLTASNFHKIITPTGKLSKQAEGYIYECVAEKIISKPIINEFTSDAMQWGKDYEDQARENYAFINNVTVENGGLFVDKNLGASPDGIVYADGIAQGLIEIKCPSAGVHLKWLHKGKINPQYKPQIYGQMIISNYQWVDWFSYHPELTPITIRTHINDDEEFANSLRSALQDASNLLDTIYGDLTTKD